MWQLASGGRMALGGRPAVAVVTDGAGALNGVPVRKGDRLVISDEADVSYAGDGALVLCLPGAAGF